MRWLLLLLLCCGPCHASEIVPAARIVAEASRAVFGASMPGDWQISIRSGDVSVRGPWRLSAEPAGSDERRRAALVRIEVDGHAVRNVAVVFTRMAVVHRGDAVKIWSRRGGIACELAGEALRDGVPGERIQVRCGRGIVSARVAGPGEVEVERR